MRRLLLLAVLPDAHPPAVKLDFLPIGSVRTDPLLNPTCLSDHIHTFYGAKASLRPETTYDDMRNASESSGNTEENMSLYWHPSVYMHDKVKGVYELGVRFVWSVVIAAILAGWRQES